MKISLTKKFTPLILSVITVIIYIDTHTLHPFLATYAKELGAETLMIGIIVAAYSVFEDIFEIIFGYVMDKVGKRRIFLVSGMLGDALIMLLYSIARNPLYLLFVRVSHGLTGSIAGPGVMSLTADIPHPLAKMGARMGLYGTSIVLATIIGWVLGGFFTERLGYSVFFYFIAGLLLIGALMSLFMEEPQPFLELDRSSERKLSGRDLLDRFSSLLKKKAYVMACLGIFAHMMTMGAMTVLLPLYVEELGMGSMVVGVSLGVYGLSALVFQIPMGVFSDRRGKIPTLLIGFAIVSASMFFLSFATSFIMLLIIMATYGAGYSFIFPTLSALIIENSKVEQRSLAAGFFHTMFTEGIVIGAPLFSAVATRYGYAVGLRTSCLAPISILLGITALFFTKGMRRR